MNDFNSTNSKEPKKTQTEIKLQTLSVLQPNTRVDNPVTSMDPVLLSAKELRDYEVEKPMQNVLKQSKEDNQVKIETKKTLLKPVPTELKTAVLTPQKPSPVSQEPEHKQVPVATPQTPLERAQSTINDYTPSIGLSLSSARRARGFELLTVAEQTRIPKSIIEIIEQSEFEKAPAPVFTRGHIKKLAEFYEIDAEILVDQYNQMLDKQRRSNPVKSSNTKPKKQERASSVNLKPMVAKTQSDGKLIKRSALIIGGILMTWLVVDCTGGKKSEVKKRDQTTITIKTVPVIKLKDLTRFSRPTELEIIKLNVPKNKIK